MEFLVGFGVLIIATWFLLDIGLIIANEVWFPTEFGKETWWKTLLMFLPLYVAVIFGFLFIAWITGATILGVINE